MAKKKMNAPTMAIAGSITVHDLATAKWLVLLSGSSTPSTGSVHSVVSASLYKASMSISTGANQVSFGLELMTMPFLSTPRKLKNNGPKSNLSYTFFFAKTPLYKESMSIPPYANQTFFGLEWITMSLVVPLPTKNFSNDDWESHEREMLGIHRRTGLSHLMFEIYHVMKPKRKKKLTTKKNIKNSGTMTKTET
uniref:Uncharacterized protein n=1 Tax=Oryza sativa subsp. japonica TaxID=39947 RepID=Q6I5W7_ORYSJ|nr:hypothetical protein [Oryza sativa Japonica Group]